MKFVPSICSVYADLVNLCGIVADILDVTQDMASGVLADKVAKVSAKTHICCSALVITPRLDWNSFKEDESFALQKVVLNVRQNLAELW